MPDTPPLGHVFERGQRVRIHIPGMPEFATVRYAIPGDAPGAWDLILNDDADRRHEVNLAPGDSHTVRPLVSDGRGDSARVLAAMWTQWMDAAATNAETSAMASTPLKPYAHQTTAVYGAMLPQPLLRFLLADEPGTGKTIMAGLYLREMQRLRPGPSRADRLSGEPRHEVGRRLRAAPRWRAAATHRPPRCARMR